ncbi:MAG: TlpA family protein disulfide reductase [Planctomycetota bacterium]
MLNLVPALLLVSLQSPTAQVAAEVLELSAGTELAYTGKATHKDSASSMTVPFELRAVVLGKGDKGTLEVALFHTLAEGSGFIGGKVRRVPASTSFSILELGADWVRAPLPGGMMPGMPMGAPATMALGDLPLPPATVSVVPGNGSLTSRIVLPTNFEFAATREWTCAQEGGALVLSASASGLPAAHAMVGTMRLMEHSQVLRIDPARRAVAVAKSNWKVEFSAEPLRYGEFGSELELRSIQALGEEAVKQLRADYAEFTALQRKSWRAEDLDAMESEAQALADRCAESNSYFAGEARALVENVVRRREMVEKERLEREFAEKLVGKDAIEVLGDVLGKDLEGKDIKLSALRGKVVVLNFYASWCGPCNVEIPILKELYAAHGADIAVIGLNKEAEREREIEHARRQGLPWPVMLGSDKVNAALLVGAFPTNCYIGRDGKILLREVGFDSKEKLKLTIERFLAGK